MGNVCTECEKMTFCLFLEEIRWLNKNCNKNRVMDSETWTKWKERQVNRPPNREYMLNLCFKTHFSCKKFGGERKRV